MTAAGLVALVAVAGWVWLWYVSRRAAEPPEWLSYPIAMGIVYGGVALLLVACFLVFKAEADDCRAHGGFPKTIGRSQICFDSDGRIMQ